MIVTMLPLVRESGRTTAPEVAYKEATAGSASEFQSPSVTSTFLIVLPVSDVTTIWLLPTPVSKFLKRKSAYRAKEAKANRFFEDMRSVSKAVKNNSCHIVMPIT
ncbi:MAG: hypothetical protein II735_03780, partial [Clostridia bacterium]|nr:hypothetical protein [Clostridia bacterium]